MAELQLVLAGFSALSKMREASAQAKAIRAAGQQQYLNAQYRAEQLETNAGQERAVAQRGAIEERRRARLAQSRAVALGAAGGGTTADITDVLSGLDDYGEYNALSRIYEGEDAARQLEGGAQLALYEGRTNLAASNYEARNVKRKGYTSAFLDFGSALYSKYAPSSSALDSDIYGRNVGTYRVR